jgi:hypothetical protein
LLSADCPADETISFEELKDIALRQFHKLKIIFVNIGGSKSLRALIKELYNVLIEE